MRRFRKSDAQAMFDNWASDDEVTHFLTWRSHSNLKITQDVIDTWCEHYNDNTYNWAITLKGCDEPIGSIGITRQDEENSQGEFGYVISRKHWGNGIVTEAMTALLDYFFNEIGFEVIDGLHIVNNPASGRVMQKLHMSYVERLCGQYNDNIGNPIDVFHYTLEKADFNALHIRKAYSHEVSIVGQLYDSLVNYMDSTKNYVGWRVGIYPTTEIAAAGFAEDALYVATVGGKIAGSVILNYTQASGYSEAKWQSECRKPLVVHTLAMNPDFLKQGVANALLCYTAEKAKKEGITSIRLDTAEGNLPARNLYEKAGYTHIGNANLGLERGGITCWYLYEKVVSLGIAF